MIELMLAAAFLQPPDPCLAVPTPPPAACPGWLLLNRQSDGELFADPGSVRRTGDTFEVRARFVFNRDQEAGFRSYHTLVWIDCVRRLGALRHITLFDAQGRQLHDFDVSGDAAQPTQLPQNAPVATLAAQYCPARGS